LYTFEADIEYLLLILQNIWSYLRKQSNINFRFVSIETHHPLDDERVDEDDEHANDEDIETEVQSFEVEVDVEPILNQVQVDTNQLNSPVETEKRKRGRPPKFESALRVEKT
jgi:hypothetical protein